MYEFVNISDAIIALAGIWNHRDNHVGNYFRSKPNGFAAMVFIPGLENLTCTAAMVLEIEKLVMSTGWWKKPKPASPGLV